MGAVFNTSLIGTPQECSQQLVHHEGANAATNIMTPEAHLKIAHKTGSRKTIMQLAMGCECIQMVVNSCK